MPWLTVVAALLVLGGSWITLPKGPNAADVRGVALTVRYPVGGAIVATEGDIVWVYGLGGGCWDEDKLWRLCEAGLCIEPRDNDG